MDTDYKIFAINLAKKAGKIIRDNFILGMKKEWKKDNSPLTQSDLIINQLVIDSVKSKFPEHSILAEEGNHLVSQSEYCWVCDPIDGTISFSHGIPTAVFSLSLVHNGQVLLGLVFDPFMNRMFYAEKGKGAFLNKKPIFVSKARSVEKTLVSVLWWPQAKYNFSILREELSKKGAICVGIPAVLYVGALVANGEFSASIFPGHLPHDTAALKIIIEEAGGKVTDVWGNEQRYDQSVSGHLATNGLLHEELIELIKKTVTN